MSDKQSVDGFTTSGCAGGSETAIELANGKQLDFLRPLETMPNIGGDFYTCVALPLADECRYARQTRERYTVAEHLLLCEEIARRHYPLAAESEREALCLYAIGHDCIEAFTKDMCRPFKLAVASYGEVARRALKNIQWGLQVAFERYYNFPQLVEVNEDLIRAHVHKIDLLALRVEAHYLMHSRGEGWGDFVWDSKLPLPILHDAWNSQMYSRDTAAVAHRFMERFNICLKDCIRVNT